MKISASFTKDRYIENFALLGEIEGGIEVSTADDVTETELMENYSSFKLQADGKTVTLDEEKLKERQKAKLLIQQQSKQNENNRLLATYLKDHPIQWKDGKYYGVTQEDQSEISLNLMQYQLAETSGFSTSLEWHALHEQCRAFTVEELSELALSISAYVYPLVRYNQSVKSTIYGTTTAEELEKIVIDYEKAGASNESAQ